MALHPGEVLSVAVVMGGAAVVAYGIYLRAAQDAAEGHATWRGDIAASCSSLFNIVMLLVAERVITDKAAGTDSRADIKEPVLITEHGQPSAYLVDVQDYEFMQRRLALLEGLSRGERAVLDGRTYGQSEAREKMSKWLK